MAIPSSSRCSRRLKAFVSIESTLISQRPPLGMVPFSSDRKFTASFHRVGDAVVAFAKGAPRRMLEMSTSVLTDTGPQPLDEERRRMLMGVNDAMAREGLRVLSLASGPVARAEESALERLTFVGFIGFADPPAPGVKQAIVTLRAAGLRTVMLTGDQRATAEAVGRELGLLTGGHTIVDGRELDAMSDSELDTRLPQIAAFSRITPEHKLRLVEALQAQGEVVAMLGDGVNDAPALRRADVGVAMGTRGTDVAKEAAAIVLQDDRFETISAAVEEGRVIFDNIRKFVFYLFSCNVAEVFVFLLAALAGLPIPLLPLQVLWLNIVTDTFPALALALEPGDATVMDRPPRDPAETLLSRQFFTSVFFYALLITLATLAAIIVYRDAPRSGDADDRVHDAGVCAVVSSRQCPERPGVDGQAGAVEPVRAGGDRVVDRASIDRRVRDAAGAHPGRGSAGGPRLARHRRPCGGAGHHRPGHQAAASHAAVVLRKIRRSKDRGFF